MAAFYRSWRRDGLQHPQPPPGDSGGGKGLAIGTVIGIVALVGAVVIVRKRRGRIAVGAMRQFLVNPARFAAVAEPARAATTGGAGCSCSSSSSGGRHGTAC
ncbi:hypothetical protein DFJ73DRAFT_774631 [Zopfochytrium polystomum]|nr:hypothetical protein DFJ73DRAFT_774631 [Zopfochytrium polystomum]